MRIYQNPPARRTKRKRKKSSLKRRGPGGRFVKVKARRKSMARRKSRKSATKRAPKRKSTKRRTTRKSSKRVRAARKGAATRRRKKAARSAAARKASRSRTRKPKYRARGRKTRPTLYKRRGRYYASPGSKVKGRRINPRRRRKSSRRRNPSFALSTFFPTKIRDFKDVAVLGGGGAVGWLGVSAVNSLMDRFGVAGLKARVASPGVASLVNAVQSAVSTFIVAGLARTFIKKPDFAKAVFIGGAAKTVHSLVVPYLAVAAGGGGAMADVAGAALSGFQEVEMAGFQERLGGFREYADTGMGYVADGLQAVALANAEGQGNAFGV